MLHSCATRFGASLCAAAACRRAPPGPGPLAALFLEGRFLAAASAGWLARLGARRILAIGDAALAEALAPRLRDAAGPGVAVDLVDAPLRGRADAAAALGALADWAEGRWILPCFNGEFPVFPGFETRRLSDLAEFQEGERRFGVGGWVADLHDEDMAAAAAADDPDWPAPAAPWFEAAGIFAMNGPPAEWERERETPPAEGRLYGGLGWRLAEALRAPPPRLDRTAFFRARRGMRLDARFRCGDGRVDGLSGPHHRSPTMAIMSFRAARLLLRDPRTAPEAARLRWAGSRRWDWSSAALLDAGAIEPGQWF